MEVKTLNVFTSYPQSYPVMWRREMIIASYESSFP